MFSFLSMTCESKAAILYEGKDQIKYCNSEDKLFFDSLPSCHIEDLEEKRKESLSKSSELMDMTGKTFKYSPDAESVRHFSLFSCHGKKMQEFSCQVKKYAKRDDCLLILGESGCGKSYAARAIHNFSSRAKGPYRSLNVANLASTLLESQLFGTVKGAYTGAESKEGLLSASKGGSLFLDEVGELEERIQTKLLSVVEEKSFTKLGDTVPEKLDSRLIYASNADLEKLVDEGKFRKDLYFRISVLVLKIPPLREHKDDIPFFAMRFALEHGKELSWKALSLLMDYSWPGNIRELKHVVSRSCLSSQKNVVNEEDIKFK